VDALVRVCDAPAAGSRLLIGTGVATSDLELNRAVAAAVGGAPPPSFAPARMGDLPHMVVDAGAARAALGWRPRVPLAEGIARTVAAMRANPEGGGADDGGNAAVRPRGGPAASTPASSR
jgi:UDP-glucose 4-epimerase